MKKSAATQPTGMAGVTSTMGAMRAGASEEPILAKRGLLTTFRPL